MLATLGATLAMVGPGAWSIDARLFGRKLINIRNARGIFISPKVVPPVSRYSESTIRPSGVVRWRNWFTLPAKNEGSNKQ